MRISDWSSDVFSSDRSTNQNSPDVPCSIEHGSSFLAYRSGKCEGGALLGGRLFCCLALLFLFLDLRAFPGVTTWRSRASFPLVRSRSEEHTSELQSLMRISYAVFCLNKKNLNEQEKIKQKNISTNTKKQQQTRSKTRIETLFITQ